jgi:branched-chain amino acid transport system substrate-binding protein
MTRVKSIFIASILLLTLALIPFVSACPNAPAEAKTLKIGQVNSLTGPMAAAFKPMGDAAKPTQDLLNQKGGVTIKGQKYDIEIVLEDDQSTPAGGVAAANRLVEQGVHFMMPPNAFPVYVAMSPITEEAKIIRIRCLGLGPEISPDLPYSFTCGPALLNFTPVCNYIKQNNPQVQKIAVLYPDEPIIFDANAKEVQDTKNSGLQVLSNDPIDPTTQDFYPLVSKVLANNPDAISLTCSILPWSSAVINSAREQGFTGLIYSPTGLGDMNALMSMINPEYANDIYSTQPDVLSDKMEPMVKDLHELSKQQGVSDFTVDSLGVLDSVWTIVQGIEEAQSLDPDDVKTALENMTSIDTIFGKGHMGGEELLGINHAVIRPIAFSKAVNGKLEYLTLEME